MDSDATALQNALAVLRQYHGERLAGSRGSTEAQMRHTLVQQLGVDELTAGRVLKKLYETGRLVYVGSTARSSTPGTGTDDDAEPDTTATGPVISMPLTQSADTGAPLVTSASPAMVMGIVDDRGGDVSQIVDTEDVAPGPIASGEGAKEGDHTQGYWRIG